MNEVCVKDLNVASYLLARGFPVVRLEGSPLRRVFVFQAPEDALLGYYADAPVPARRLLGALRDLKGLLTQPA